MEVHAHTSQTKSIHLYVLTVVHLSERQTPLIRKPASRKLPEQLNTCFHHAAHELFLHFFCAFFVSGDGVPLDAFNVEAFAAGAALNLSSWV